MNLKGAMDLITKSAYPLAPLYEAMTNSLESIAQKKFEDNEASEITVRLHFTGLLDEVKELSQIEVIDNGVGFTGKNYDRFVEFFDKSKGYDNRGSGRLQYLHRFEKIDVHSIYSENNLRYERRFSCSSGRFIYDESNKPTSTNDAPFLTKVIMSGCLAEAEEKEFFNNLTIDDLLKDIVRHFLLRFYLDNQKDDLNVPLINIEFLKDNKDTETRTLLPKDIPSPQANGQIDVAYMRIKNAKAEKIEWEKVKGKSETIKWAHFKIPEDDLQQNGVYLCSKDIPVQSLAFKEIKKKESVDGFRYLTAFYGSVLDKAENVSDTVDSFKFPDKRTVEESASGLFFDKDSEYILADSIKEKVTEVIPAIYKDIFDLQEQKEKDIESIAKAHGISMNVALQANINLTDNEETITKKIYAEQSSLLAKKGYQAKKLYESLNQLSPISENYQDELEKKVIELSELIEDQNKEELSRYIIRREMVADILKKILAGELEYQTKSVTGNKDKEGLVHNLIFKRKSKDVSVLNDLWILNEEFLHFNGCSELKLDQIKDHDGNKLLKDIPEETIKSLGIKIDRRPDIFLFAEEGKCVLIELKAPDVDMADHLNQMTKYCNLIANYSNKKFDRFYCYLIGEKINALTDIPGDYEETVNGDWLKADLPIKSFDKNRDTIATSQIEVIKLSSIHERAHRRNKSFAEKLGLPDLLSDKIEKKN